MGKKRVMNAAEKVVERLLSDMELESVKFEPDGNHTPDFLVDGKIAVEVRSLTQIHDDGSGPKGLTEVAISLTQRVEKLLLSFNDAAQPGWWVSFGFRRPVPEWKVLERELRKALKEFLLSPNKCNGRIYDSRYANVEVYEASIPTERFLMLSSIQDHEAGGWVVAEFLKSINHCVEEKTQKISLVRHKYGEWWLVLVNYTGMALDDRDRDQLLENLQPHPYWDKVLIVTASEPPKYFEC